MANPQRDVSFLEDPELQEHKGNTNFLFISLYSLILAFFILLYSKAEISQQKAAAAVGSVQKSFKGQAATIEQPESVNEAPLGAEVLLRQYYSEIRKVARELLEIDDASIIEKGDQLIIRLPTFLLFNEGESTVDDRKLFLENLANGLTTTPVGLQLDLEFKIPQPALIEKPAESLAIRRAGAFARFMVSLGIPESSIYVGLSDETAEMIEITLSPRNASQRSLEF